MADIDPSIANAPAHVLACIRATDSVDDLTEPVNALTALEELLQLQRQEFMREVNSQHLAALVTLVNRELYTRLETAKNAVEAALEYCQEKRPC